MNLFTPFEDGEPGSAETFNKRLAEIEAYAAGQTSSQYQVLTPYSEAVNPVGPHTIEIPVATMVQVAIWARSSATTTADNLVIQFNGSTTPTHYQQYFYFFQNDPPQAVVTGSPSQPQITLTYGASNALNLTAYWLFSFMRPGDTGGAKAYFGQGVSRAGSTSLFYFGGGYFNSLDPLQTLVVSCATGAFAFFGHATWGIV